ncbi:MAG: glycosyltransferase family 4 protein [Acidobacteria bacterium]|jgi:glycosyltransferase involved in cell wall biosynthesis|nr:glycosyltransferase family 4 protein [Acidobacteriota bacterium]
MKKKVLVIYPHNFFAEKNGINSRYIELLRYFRAVDINVDLLTLKNFKSPWENWEDPGGFIDKIFFYDFKKGGRWQSPKNRKQNPLAWLKKYIPFTHAYTSLPDFAYSGMKKLFNEIIQTNHYDFIIISYVYWAGLISIKTMKNITTILDLSDFITLNRFDSSGGNIKIGSMIEEEIRRVNLFDKVMCISEDEKNFFSQFAQRPQYYYVPFFMEKNSRSRDKDFEYHVIFTGSDNPHNRKGIQWFFEKIYPNLFGSIRIVIVGSITKYIPAAPNVICIPMIERISEIYHRSKLAICPLLGGTGMKIKVVEALSFGLPVVTTAKGLVGFPSKIKNGCLVGDTPEKFANMIHRLLFDKDFYDQQQGYAEDFFQGNFEKTAVYRCLDNLFTSDINKMDTQVINIQDKK